MEATESTGPRFPVELILPEVSEALKTSHVVIEAPPGAGKSTILPSWLLENTDAACSRIILIQPRRVAAVSVARFIAQQLHEPLGERVGYHIRQQRVASSATKLLVVTEGVFTRMVQRDPELSGVSHVIFDEFHERNLHSDLGLALALDVLELRPSLRLLIMSATLPGVEIEQWLRRSGVSCRLLKSEGRTYPIDYHYRPVSRLSDWLKALPSVIAEAMQSAERGVLVFVPGRREMRYVARQLKLPTDVQYFELHGQLSIESQRRVLQPLQTGRKLVLATNLAETSLTIPDIDVVVDSGRERQPIYDPRYGVTRLDTRMISRASAGQRAGRAGRVGPGTCFRLWSAEQTERLDAYGQPAIARENLAELVLELHLWGAQAEQLKWFSPPQPRLLADAQQRLLDCGALASQPNDEQKVTLTPLGRQLSVLGTELQFARAITHAQLLSESAQQLVAWTVAVLESRELQLDGDVSESLLDSFAQAAKYPRSGQRYQHWQLYLGFSNASRIQAEVWKDAMPALVEGFGERVVKVANGRLQMANGLALNAPERLPTSDWLLALEVTVGDDLTQASLWSFLPLPYAVLESMPHALKHTRERAYWRGERGGLGKRVQQCWGQLVLKEADVKQAVSAEQVVEALLDWVRQHGIRQATAWTEKTDQLLARLSRFKERQIEQLAGYHICATEGELVAELEVWAGPFLTQVKTRDALLKWSPEEALLAQLTYAEQQLLNRLYPNVWLAPSGRTHRIEYAVGEPPKVALKLQEVFGTPQSPRIAEGREVITFELLSPAGRPLQRTADLASFWQQAWPLVRKEMRGRYPKHPWPEDPLQAEATHLSKRQAQLKATNNGASS